ncbi:MAG: hypothetical protein GW748_01145 [Alphaproteobacteria bacterium]|nr:hypothetical protein [Alphaproteobacteria bacterium]NCQ66339.1 hypothetical protein [Alphaproteobacteria bacterium]NCT06825.1 hypothetical protein [Alphaproteobacteria bacterium]
MTLQKKLSPKLNFPILGKVTKIDAEKVIIPAVIPYLSKSGQLLLPKGLLPILVKAPKDIKAVEKALMQGRYLGIIQPLKEFKDKKCLYQVGCVGRITTFSENEDGSLYLILKGIRRFLAKSSKDGLLHVDYSPYDDDRVAFDGDKPSERGRLMELLKGYLNSVNMEINWNDITAASDESLATSLAMMCPFDANEKQAILESSTINERIEMITAFIEMSTIKKSPLDWMPH